MIYFEKFCKSIVYFIYLFILLMKTLQKDILILKRVA